ncbi:MAG: zinc-dependent metalloprotease [Bacteroidota bacterium]|nr:zinc-dependent metalloprotease [Bacteroidota bacterium]
MKKNILFLYLFISSTLLFSQENHKKCNTNHLVNEEIKNNADYYKARINETKPTNPNTEKTTITIPIVVHIIHRTSHANIGSGTNISDEQIEDQLRILNEDYSKTNPEVANPPRTIFSNYWGNPDLQFCLATTDPNGNPTNGITRTPTTQVNWDADDDSSNPCHEANGMKKTACGGRDGWDPYKYMNIWVCDLTNSGGLGMTLGYAYLPGLLANPFNTSDDYKDGLVVDYRYFGTIDNAAPSSDGRTATHEIGHYLGLNHTFSEPNYPSYSCLDNNQNLICCDRDDGNVDDTPATDGIYFGVVTSNTNNNTCNDLAYSNIFNTDVKDMDENYMSYAANTWMFSQGQVDAMRGTLNASEFNLGRLSLKNSDVSTNCSGIISQTNNITSNIKLNIYPNPSKGNVFINSSEKIISFSVVNILGEKVISNNNINSNQLDLNQLNDGVYFINISTNKGIITQKIIIAK